MPWQSSWFDSGVRVRGSRLWRGVEAQHVVSTMRLVDSLEEQKVLEDLLESSKPPLPPGAANRHYLIFTPFRYRSPVPTRFRRPTDPGVWYGCEEMETACAEVAYWKWRFLIDSDALAREALHTEHTFFEAQAHGECTDLTHSPWSAAARVWSDKASYSACQDFAAEVRTREVAWIRYASARAAKGICGAVLKAEALTLPHAFDQQTWACKTNGKGAYLQHRGSARALSFSAKDWA